MLDAVTFEKMGIPAVPISTGEYEQSARRWAELQGFEEFCHAIVRGPHTNFGAMTNSDIEQAADQILVQVVNGVLAKPPVTKQIAE